MQAIKTPLKDVLLLQPKVFEDTRGFFFESFNQKTFNESTGLSVTFVQDNHSKSARHVLRGLHYQTEHAQGKLVRVVSGEIFDVAVDIRPTSPTYGKWFGCTLSCKNKSQLWVPPGLAHGFLVLSDTAELLYKTTNYYHPASERCLAWNDPTVAINWPFPSADDVPILSNKDQLGHAFGD